MKRKCHCQRPQALAAALLLIAFIAPAAAQPARSGSAGRIEGDPKDKAALHKNGEAFIEAFHKGDAKALADFWIADGDYADQTGRHLKGREAIQKAFEALFSEHKGLKLRIDSLKLRFVTPDVAIEDGTTEILSPDGGPPTRARYTNVHVKDEGRWLLSSVRESPLAPPGNSEHLRGLEWLIGEWTNEGQAAEVAQFSIAWADNQSFLVSSFTSISKSIPIGGDTQWIGWDPLAKRVRSWIFDTDGGFGEGSWTKDGNKWIIETKGVLPDGRKVVATNIVTRIDADTVSWQSRNRAVEGTAEPDSKAIKLKRVRSLGGN